MYYQWFLTCWVNRSVTKEQLEIAVRRKIITRAEADEIMTYAQVELE